jgi:hypothetical protein
MNTKMTPAPTQSARARSAKTWTGLRHELHQRRQDAAEYRSLERELASYNTRAEVDDLLASFRDAEGPDVEKIRGILQRNRPAC